jgi:hypothetical protein
MSADTPVASTHLYVSFLVDVYLEVSASEKSPHKR